MTNHRNVQSFPIAEQVAKLDKDVSQLMQLDPLVAELCLEDYTTLGATWDTQYTEPGKQLPVQGWTLMKSWTGGWLLTLSRHGVYFDQSDKRAGMRWVLSVAAGVALRVGSAPEMKTEASNWSEGIESVDAVWELALVDGRLVPFDSKAQDPGLPAPVRLKIMVRVAAPACPVKPGTERPAGWRPPQVENRSWEKPPELAPECKAMLEAAAERIADEVEA